MRLLASGLVVSLAVSGLALSAQQRGAQPSQPARPNPSTPPGNDWPMFGVDVGRSSAFMPATGITADNVGTLTRQQVPIDGVVDASLIYLRAIQVGGAPHDVFFATTTYGKTVAIDAKDGAVLWTYVPPGFETWQGTRQITNSTPVADPGRQHIYVASPDGKIARLAVADGKAVWSTAITRLPAREKIASPLAFFRGRVIAVTAGYIGDAPPYQGHVAILDGATGQLQHVWNSLCSDQHELIEPASCTATRSAIWGRSGAVIDATTGNIYVATGNGPWDGKTSWGDAVIVLDPDATKMIGNYTPSNTEELNASDADVGSTSPVLLGGGFVAQGGKDNVIRLLGPQTLAGDGAHRGGELQSVPTPSGTRLFTAPAVWRTATGTWMFAADGGGTAAWTFANNTLQPAWKNTSAGTSPVVAGGLLYVYDPRGGLRVYEPESGAMVANLEAGPGHWNSPIVVDGRIAAPEGGSSRGVATSGVINIWRVPAK